MKTIVLISSILLWKKIHRGKLEEKSNEINIDFSLKGGDRYSSTHDFAHAYYYDELKSKGYDADFALKWSDEKKTQDTTKKKVE
jgi:hypothetical protein